MVVPNLVEGPPCAQGPHCVGVQELGCALQVEHEWIATVRGADADLPIDDKSFRPSPPVGDPCQVGAGVED